MSGEEAPREADVEAANSQLNEGLKACRAMVANYRAIMAADQEAKSAGDMSHYVSSTTNTEAPYPGQSK